MKKERRDENEEKAEKVKERRGEENAEAQGIPPAWKVKPMTKERADDIRDRARTVLDEKLEERLKKLQDRTHVTEEELELMVKDCMHEVGRDMLGQLLECGPWIEEMENATHWTCADCGGIGSRAIGKDGEKLFDDMELQTTLGPTAWHAPLFSCRTCRRFFSPGAGLF